MAERLIQTSIYCFCLALIQFTLSSFYVSTSPLLGAGQLELGQQFSAVEISDAGEILKQPGAKPSVINFSATGLRYAGTWDDKRLWLTLNEYDTAARLYGFQLQISSGGSPSPLVTYGLMTIEDQTVQLFFPNDDARSETRDQVFDSLRGLSAHLSSARKVRFAIAANPEQLTGGLDTAKTSDTFAMMMSGAPAQVPDDDTAFPTDEYFSPAAFRAMYAGALTPASFRSQSVYWYTFAYAFYINHECAHLVSRDTMEQFLILAQIGELKGVLDSLTNQNRNYELGDWGAAVESALNSALPNLQRETSSVLHGQADARLFYRRHQCSSPVSERFFSNMEKVVARL